MDPIREHTQMDELNPIEQAKKAIRHTLERIHENPIIGYQLGWGTQSFALLTEAAATLFGEAVVEVRETFAPQKTRDAESAFRALEEILGRFEELNGMECDRGCGRCIRCIARRGLKID